MRLRTLNRLTQVSSAVVTTLLIGTGCQVQKPVAQAPGPMVPPTSMEWVQVPATTQSQAGSASQPTTEAATQPATMPLIAAPVTMPTTAPETQPVAIAGVVPVTQPTAATAPAPEPSTGPTTAQVISQATTQASPQPTTVASTSPSTGPATTEASTEPTLPPIADAPFPDDPHQIAADAALAEQIAGIAELEFANQVTRNDVWPAIYRHQAALLQACTTLDPKQARFPRLQADAMAQLHDREGELEALRKAINENPRDEFSWNRRLDLFLIPMQTATDRVEYLRHIVGMSTGDTIIPADVRAHAGFRLAQVLLQRGEEDGAAAALDEALRTCPSSVECLTLRYQMLPPDAPKFERCKQLMDLLKANPLQLQYSTLLADLVADLGLVQESLPWYQLAVSTAHLRGEPGRHQMLNWAAELFIGDEKLDAANINSALLRVDPAYTPAYFLQLVMVRDSGDKDAFTKTLQEATNAMLNRLVYAINAAAPPNAVKASTRPILEESPLRVPDLSSTIARLKDPSASPRLKEEFVQALADLALLESDFAQDSEKAQQLVDSLKAMLPDNAPELARLGGWNDLLNKKPDDAKAKFAPVAADDPIAELGLIKAMMDNPAERTNAQSMARRLMQDHPSGLIGAIVFEQLHGDRVKLITTTQADALREALSAFPTEVINLVQRPQNFYAMHVEPIRDHIGTYYSEPLLAEVRVENLSDYDLTIGPDGVLKPDLLFSMTPRLEKAPTMTAFDNIAGPTVVPSHSGFTQDVRVDQTQLLAYLDSQTNQQYEINGVLTTNESARQLGGYPVQFLKNFFRRPSGLNPVNMNAATVDLDQGRPDQKITSINLLQLFVQQLEKIKNPKAEIRRQVAEMIAAIHRARFDPLPAVSAWAGQSEFALSGTDQRIAIVKQLAEDPDWRHRQIALLLVNGADKSLRDEIVEKLSADPQSSVRAEAMAVKQFLALPPSTQPSTEPTTAPVVTPP